MTSCQHCSVTFLPLSLIVDFKRFLYFLRDRVGYCFNYQTGSWFGLRNNGSPGFIFFNKLKSLCLLCLLYLYVQAQLSLDIDLHPPPTYTQRGTNTLQVIFKEHFDEFAENYDAKHAKTYGRFRIERITETVDNFIGCGDYTQGVARIRCTNPECKEEFFRPFSCKGFYLCPSCSQKRTLLFLRVYA